MSRNKAILLAACVLALAAVAVTLAAADSLTDGFAIPWWTVDNGGGTLSGTAGQPDAANLSGGSYALRGGFWSGPDVIPGIPTIYLPLIIR